MRTASRFLAAGVLATGIVLAAACVGDAQRSSLPLVDDFSGECSWPEEAGAYVSHACEEGEYRVSFDEIEAQGLTRWVIPRRLERSVESVRVETDATLRELPGSSEDFAFHGTGCWAAAGRGYLFVVRQQGSSGSEEAVAGIAAILKHDEEGLEENDGAFLLSLAEQDLDEPVTAGRIGGECRAADGAVELRLYADGREVAEATDADGYRSFEWVGLVVSSTSAGTEIRYDNFEADDID